MSRRLALAVVIITLWVRPQAASAHGDVHLQILALTRQIEAATNCPPAGPKPALEGDGGQPLRRGEGPARLYLERGELQREHGLWEAAGTDYDRAAQLDPGLPGIDRCRANLLADRGQLEAARTLFDQAIERSPGDGECLVGRGRVLVRLGQCQAAIEDYWRGLERLQDPQPQYVLELARLLTAEGNVEEALRALDEGVKRLGPILPLQGYALDLEQGRKNHDAALARLETILARAMRKESWFARRGDILLEAGQAADARRSYEAALAAVKRLPGRLQQGPAMVKLQAQVNAALAGITNALVAEQSK